MRVCPKCSSTYPANEGVCAGDGTPLVDERDLSEAVQDPLVDRIVAGRYHILERIGTGNMGSVYRATQVGLERSVALKVLRGSGRERDTVTRFHREAKAMSVLNHPNTVKVFDFGETEDGLLYFAMELLEGELLSTRMKRESGLGIDEAVMVVRQVLHSLHEAHSKGIIHRDLKPDNIFLASHGGHGGPVVKVLDFGIAKIFHGDRVVDELETQAGTVFGTPRYMSPEQAQGKPLDGRSDLYSVGVLLYHLLTGVAPFTDDDAVVVMAKHIRDKPMGPRRRAPDRNIASGLEHVVLSALDKDPERRFETARDFDAALEAAMEEAAGPPLRARPAPTSPLAALPTIPLVVAAVMLSMAVGIAAYLVTHAASFGTTQPVPPVTATPPPRLTPQAIPTPQPTSPTVEVTPEPAAPQDASGTEALSQAREARRAQRRRARRRRARAKRRAMQDEAAAAQGEPSTAPYERW